MIFHNLKDFSFDEKITQWSGRMIYLPHAKLQTTYNLLKKLLRMNSLCISLKKLQSIASENEGSQHTAKHECRLNRILLIIIVIAKPSHESLKFKKKFC